MRSGTVFLHVLDASLRNLFVLLPQCTPKPAMHNLHSLCLFVFMFCSNLIEAVWFNLKGSYAGQTKLGQGPKVFGL